VGDPTVIKIFNAPKSHKNISKELSANIDENLRPNYFMLTAT